MTAAPSPGFGGATRQAWEQRALAANERCATPGLAALSHGTRELRAAAPPVHRPILQADLHAAPPSQHPETP